jgi:hypothetical protein
MTASGTGLFLMRRQDKLKTDVTELVFNGVDLANAGKRD